MPAAGSLTAYALRLMLLLDGAWLVCSVLPLNVDFSDSVESQERKSRTYLIKLMESVRRQIVRRYRMDVRDDQELLVCDP